jgi:hypothetical protein
MLGLATVFLAATYLVANYKTWRYKCRSAVSAPPSEAIFSIVVAVVLGLVSATLPAQLIPTADGSAALFLGGFVAALMAGSTFAAEYSPAALSFLTLVWIGVMW